MPDSDIIDLQKTLWVVMDPWSDQPNRSNQWSPEKLTYINNINDFIAKKIAEYFEAWKIPYCNILICTDLNNGPVHFKLRQYFTISSNVYDIWNYMEKQKFKNIIYTGFHHGVCLLHRKAGALQGRKLKYNTYIHREFIAPLADDSWITNDYKTLRVGIPMITGDFSYRNNEYHTKAIQISKPD